jgi:hypothetical protein
MPFAIVFGALAWIAQKSASPISDPDDWWHLRLGNDLIHQRSLAPPSHWSSFATASWVPTEPLPEVVSAYVDRWLGLPGLAWLLGLTAMLVAVTVQLTNRREAAVLPASVATVFAVLAGSGSLTSRPQLVSFVLLPIVLAAWLQTERDLKPRWWLIPLTWFWSLCHGFWFFGVGYGFLFVVGIALSRRASPAQLARLGAVAVGSFVVVALNPVGLGVLEAPFAVHSFEKYVTEWQRTQLLLPGPLGALTMIVGTALIWAFTRRGVTVARVLMLLSAAFLLWYAVRLVIVAGLVSAPLFAGALDTLIAQTSKDHQPRERVSRREVGLLGGWVAASLVVLALVVPHTAEQPSDVPLALDSQLDRLPSGTPVFNAYELGGWLVWRHPDLEQYIDGLITPYTPQHAEDFHTAESQTTGWYDVVQRSRAPVALVSSDSALAHGLEHKGWSSTGKDAGYVLLVKPGYSLAPSS